MIILYVKGFKMRNITLLFVVLLVHNILCVKASNLDFFHKNDSIVFSYKTETKIFDLILWKNLDFQYNCIFTWQDTIQHFYTITGTYLLSDTKLFLKPIAIRSYSKTIKGNDKQNCTELNYNSSDFKIKTIYDIIIWEDKAFLISPENLDEFKIYHLPDMIEYILFFNKKGFHINDYYLLAQYINRGYTTFYNLPFLNKTIDSCFSISANFDLSQIPKPFKGWFETSQISANVTKCDSCNPSIPLCAIFMEKEIGIPLYIIELNKGSFDNIELGTIFYYDHAKKIFIVEVKEKKSIGISTIPFPVDDIVNTKLE